MLLISYNCFVLYVLCAVSPHNTASTIRDITCVYIIKLRQVCEYTTNASIIIVYASEREVSSSVCMSTFHWSILSVVKTWEGV